MSVSRSKTASIRALYDPDDNVLEGWQRQGRKLEEVDELNGFISPRLGVTFRVPRTEPMKVVRPDGDQFRSYLELIADAEAARQRAAELITRSRMAH